MTFVTSISLTLILLPIHKLLFLINFFDCYIFCKIKNFFHLLHSFIKFTLLSSELTAIKLDWFHSGNVLNSPFSEKNLSISILKSILIFLISFDFLYNIT
jgi:hypothetical protein